MKFGAVILAAGASERMGRCKALLEYAGETAVARLSRCAREGGGATRIVVVASKPHLDQVKSEGQRLGIGVVENKRPDAGRTGSVQLGLQAVRDRDAAFLAPVDNPLAGPEDFRALADALVSDSSADAAVPMHGGRRGHPVLLGSRIAAEIAGRSPDEPLRNVLHSASFKILPVEVSSDRVLANVDTPQDYEAAVRRLAAVAGV